MSLSKAVAADRRRLGGGGGGVGAQLSTTDRPRRGDWNGGLWRSGLYFLLCDNSSCLYYHNLLLLLLLFLFNHGIDTSFDLIFFFRQGTNHLPRCPIFEDPEESKVR